MRMSESGARPIATRPESGRGYVASRPSPITTRQRRPLGAPSRSRFGVDDVDRIVASAGFETLAADISDSRDAHDRLVELALGGGVDADRTRGARHGRDAREQARHRFLREAGDGG